MTASHRPHLLFGLALLGLVMAEARGLETIEADDNPASRRIVVTKVPVRNGMYDPSVEYDTQGVGWMAYSRVTLPSKVDTVIAKSTNRGKTWRFVKLVNASVPGSVRRNGAIIKGVWRYETPSLVHDPGDSARRRWKLFTHRYLVEAPYGDEDRDLAGGHIEYRYAAAPQGPWSKPIRLFGKTGTGARVDINSLARTLRGNAFYTEIGTVENNGVLYMSLDASATASGVGAWGKRKLILLASHDHARTWSYAGTLTNFLDALSFGYAAFTGSSLAAQNGRLFALITPTGTIKPLAANRGHDGTFVVEFSDIGQARLMRDRNGKLAVSQALLISSKAGSGGLSDYDEQNTAGGVLLPQVMPTLAPKVYQVYNTGVSLR